MLTLNLKHTHYQPSPVYRSKMTSPVPKIIKIMSLGLFHKVPAGAIETFFDDQNQPLFKRADLGKYLGIEDIKPNFKDFPLYYTHPRLDLQVGRFTPSVGRTKNPHNIFISPDGSMEMDVRSKKPKAAALVKWLTKKGVKKYRKNINKPSQTVTIKSKPLSLEMSSINRKF